ncbi:MAG TPA: ABC transporter permease [Marmoricola sp.]|nr:ABC transporter permease [Marmoricola sp.]
MVLETISTAHLARDGAAVVLIALTTAGLARFTHIALGWASVTAILRAMLQLAIIALALRGILSYPGTVALFVLLMLATASWTAGGRIKELWQGRRAATMGVLAGSAAAISLVFVLQLVPFGVRYVVAIGGIVIGNSMSAATLAGRNFLRSARARHGEIEGWLALGATSPRAVQEIVRDSVRESLLANLDQTRATGLVTLPGAFVGALFGGLDPVAAAVFQLTVLSAVALAMLVSALVVTHWVAQAPVLPEPLA